MLDLLGLNEPASGKAWPPDHGVHRSNARVPDQLYSTLHT
jgi:hypothetical protein